MSKIKSIEKIFNKAISTTNIHEGVVLAENTIGDFSVSFGHGGKDVDSSIMTASIGKMYTATCLLILCEKKMLALSDPLSLHFDKNVLEGLHMFKGADYARKLTISHLLFQNSGLPDPFEEGGAKKEAIAKDVFTSFEQKLAKVKKMRPHFPPGENRAYYSDFNYDLLGEVIQNKANMPFHELLKKFVFDPLGLTKTYLPSCENDYVPNIYYKADSMHRPKTLMSYGAGGACVSTARETMLLLKSFWNGSLFPKKMIESLTVYRKLNFYMYPIRYGGGHMQIPLDGLMSFVTGNGFTGKGELLGHNGSTSCAAFYCPTKDLYIVCDFNQLANSGFATRFTTKLALSL